MANFVYTQFKRSVGQKKINLGADQLALALFTASYSPNQDTDALYAQAAPAAPTVTPGGSGNTVPTGSYQVYITYHNSAGETAASAVATVSITLGQSITINSPTNPNNACDGWYAYVTQANVTGTANAFRQQPPNSPTVFGNSLIITANPTTTGAAAPTSSTASITGEVPGSPPIGYSTGGSNLGSVSWIVDPVTANHRSKLTANNVQWVVTGIITFRYAVLYDTITNDLIALYDPGASQTGPSNGTININWDATNGVLTET